MKNIFILFCLSVITLSIISCGSKNSSGSESTESAVDAEGQEIQTKVYGIYNGILPCNNCAGIQTVIHILENGTYTKRFIYLGTGSDEVNLEEGTYTLNADSTVITLTGPASSIQYNVNSDYITQLNEDGQPYNVSGAGSYILKRAEIVTPTTTQ